MNYELSLKTYISITRQLRLCAFEIKFVYSLIFFLRLSIPIKFIIYIFPSLLFKGKRLVESKWRRLVGFIHKLFESCALREALVSFNYLVNISAVWSSLALHWSFRVLFSSCPFNNFFWEHCLGFTIKCMVAKKTFYKVFLRYFIPFVFFLKRYKTDSKPIVLG